MGGGQGKYDPSNRNNLKGALFHTKLNCNWPYKASKWQKNLSLNLPPIVKDVLNHE